MVGWWAAWESNPQALSFELSGYSSSPSGPWCAVPASNREDSDFKSEMSASCINRARSGGCGRSRTFDVVPDGVTALQAAAVATEPHTHNVAEGARVERASPGIPEFDCLAGSLPCRWLPFRTWHPSSDLNTIQSGWSRRPLPGEPGHKLMLFSSNLYSHLDDQRLVCSYRF